MERETLIDMEDGDQAVLITELLHGTQRRIEEITRPFMIYPTTKMKIAEGQVIDAEVKSTEVEIDWEKADLTAIDDACILGQVKSWSFGEETAEDLGLNPGSAPVTQEILDGLRESKYKILKGKIDEVFAKVPLPESGARK